MNFESFKQLLTEEESKNSPEKLNEITQDFSREWEEKVGQSNAEIVRGQELIESLVGTNIPFNELKKIIDEQNQRLDNHVKIVNELTEWYKNKTAPLIQSHK